MHLKRIELLNVARNLYIGVYSSLRTNRQGNEEPDGGICVRSVLVIDCRLTQGPGISFILAMVKLHKS